MSVEYWEAVVDKVRDQQRLVDSVESRVVALEHTIAQAARVARDEHDGRFLDGEDSRAYLVPAWRELFDAIDAAYPVRR